MKYKTKVNSLSDWLNLREQLIKLLNLKFNRNQFDLSLIYFKPIG